VIRYRQENPTTKKHKRYGYYVFSYKYGKSLEKYVLKRPILFVRNSLNIKMRSRQQLLSCYRMLK